jgi:hypothetical protein
MLPMILMLISVAAANATNSRCHSDRSRSASDAREEPAVRRYNRGRAALQRRVKPPPILNPGKKSALRFWVAQRFTAAIKGLSRSRL